MPECSAKPIPMPELVVLLGGAVAGRVEQKANRLSFVYDDDWRRSVDAYPLSLSMPLTAKGHSHAAINAFIWGLLPDNERTLDRWAKDFQVSARNPFALIGAVGEDCAGAVQFVRPDRLDMLQGAGAQAVDWLDERAIGDRLRSVVGEAGTGRTAGDNGQFSLAGAQPKTALLRDGDRWGIPAGRIPTTHILKPPARDLPGHAENEHLCLSLARALGLRTARSEVSSFDGQLAIVVTRYDRIVDGGPGYENLVRIHQEDMCQSMAVLPAAKYENEGGPTAKTIAALILNAAHRPLAAGDDLDGGKAADLWTFIDALIFNWIIGGTDAHAKNYSFLIGAGGVVRLAPLYDLASAFGLPDIQPQRMKMAMKIGGYYHLDHIVLRHWTRWAATVGMDAEIVIARIRSLAARLPDALAKVAGRMRGDGLDHPVVARLERLLAERALKVLAM